MTAAPPGSRKRWSARSKAGPKKGCYRDFFANLNTSVRDQLRHGTQLDRQIQKIVHREISDRSGAAAQRQIVSIRLQIDRLEDLGDHDSMSDRR